MDFDFLCDYMSLHLEELHASFKDSPYIHRDKQENSG